MESPDAFPYVESKAQPQEELLIQASPEARAREAYKGLVWLAVGLGGLGAAGALVWLTWFRGVLHAMPLGSLLVPYAVVFAVGGAWAARTGLTRLTARHSVTSEGLRLSALGRTRHYTWPEITELYYDGRLSFWAGSRKHHWPASPDFWREHGEELHRRWRAGLTGSGHRGVHENTWKITKVLLGVLGALLAGVWLVPTVTMTGNGASGFLAGTLPAAGAMVFVGVVLLTLAVFLRPRRLSLTPTEIVLMFRRIAWKDVEVLRFRRRVPWVRQWQAREEEPECLVELSTRQVTGRVRVTERRHGRIESMIARLCPQAPIVVEDEALVLPPSGPGPADPRPTFLALRRAARPTRTVGMVLLAGGIVYAFVGGLALLAMWLSSREFEPRFVLAVAAGPVVGAAGAFVALVRARRIDRVAQRLAADVQDPQVAARRRWQRADFGRRRRGIARLGSGT